MVKKVVKKVVKVPEEIVSDVQAKDIEAQVAREVILQILEGHKLDDDASFLESPVFKSYEKAATAKRIAFDKAKTEMASKVIPKKDMETAKEWSCDYFTNELTYTM